MNVCELVPGEPFPKKPFGAHARAHASERPYLGFFGNGPSGTISPVREEGDDTVLRDDGVNAGCGWAVRDEDGAATDQELGMLVDQVTRPSRPHACQQVFDQGRLEEWSGGEAPRVLLSAR